MSGEGACSASTRLRPSGRMRMRDGGEAIGLRRRRRRGGAMAHARAGWRHARCVLACRSVLVLCTCTRVLVCGHWVESVVGHRIVGLGVAHRTLSTCPCVSVVFVEHSSPRGAPGVCVVSRTTTSTVTYYTQKKKSSPASQAQGPLVFEPHSAGYMYSCKTWGRG